MTLRARLTLFFVAIVVAPLIVAGLLVRAAIAREVDQRTDIQLRGDVRSLGLAWQIGVLSNASKAREAADAIAVAFRDRFPFGEPEASSVLDEIRTRNGLDYLVVEGAAGRVQGSIGQTDLLPGATAITLERLLDPGSLSPLIVPATVSMQGQRSGILRVIGGSVLDQDGVRALSRAAGGVPVEVVVDGRTVSSSLRVPIPVPPRVGGVFRLAKGLRATFTSIGLPAGATAPDGIVAIASLRGDVATLQNVILFVLVGSVLLVSLLSFGLARAVSEPIRRLADQASAALAESPVLAGAMELPVERTADEVTTLASTLSLMSEHLDRYATELSHSREELGRGLERLGTTLRSTHDLHGMLAVVLDSAAWALGAESGAIYLVDPMDSGLHVEVSRGIEPAAFRIRAGEGIAGRSALTSTTVLVPSDGAPAPAASEPLRATAVAVPLIRGDRTAGVVALYGRVGGEPFSLQEGSTLAAFAREAAVAVENVLSHQQAERLSMTDALTGAGNRRVLEVSLAREIERARRYRRSVSLLMVDIDRFKRVNDDLGHQRGDQVLVEVARRLEESLRRDVDTIVRYGGEEFVVVLPETEEAGAVEVAERARAAVAEEPFGHSVALEVGSANGRTQRGTLQTALSVTVSVGVASYPEDGDSSDALIRAADLAMYAAKGRGGDQVACTKRSGMGGAGLVG